LLPAQRSRRYRELADAALAKARHAKLPGLRAEYLAMAAGWHALAQEMEDDIRARTQLEASVSRLRRVEPKQAG
jgi:hypothetical protein